MKKNFLLPLFVFITCCSVAQPWIDKTFSYDSTLNVNYGSAVNFNGGTDSLKMDIYSPQCADANARRPLMLLIHGGAFLGGSRYDPSILKLTRDFVQRGYVTAAIEYRLGFISDDVAHTCNLPDYNCVFATDTAEWLRSAYRAVQDAKGALRFLMNRNAQYRIDTNNVFVVGESAGGIIALGVAYLDTVLEKPLPAFAINNAPLPHSSALNCAYNSGQTFSAPDIARPDLGSIDGPIEPSTVKYTIKGVGNFYGAITSDIFQYSKAGTTNPALYLYHQPCDLVVPFNQGKVQQGISWCLSNCFNCFGISNTPVVIGSMGIKNMITSNNYSIQIYDDMTSTPNPNNCLIGTGSCADQLNNPCHAIDNYTTRTGNMAAFFAGKISGLTICQSGITHIPARNKLKEQLSLAPNPFAGNLNVFNTTEKQVDYELINLLGQKLEEGHLHSGDNVLTFDNRLRKGMYILQVTDGVNAAAYRIVYAGE